MKNALTQIKKRREARKSRRTIEACLTLTSLVDVFTILVLYLLVGTSFGTEVSVAKGIKLPTAAHSINIKPSLMINVVKHEIYFENKVVSLETLANLLTKQRGENKSITIQADKSASFSDLNPVVLVGLNAGFTDIQFAVTQGDDV